MAKKCKRNYVYLPGDEKGGAGILDRGRAVGAAQKDQAAVRRAVLSKSDAAAVELLLCVCGRAYGRRKTGRICLLLSALPKNAGDYKAKHAPFAVRTAHRALMTSEYGLWKLQGKWFPLIA